MYHNDLKGSKVLVCRNRPPLSVRPQRLFFALLLLVGLLPLTGYAQKSKAQLEREKKQILRKREEANKILQETANEKQATLGQLNALNQQITSRTQVITIISKEVSYLDADIADLSQISYAMENDIINLKQEYAAMVYAAAKASSGYNKLVFIFSASNFNQLVMRLKYLQYYSEARKTQISQIERMKGILTKERLKLDAKKQEKYALLQAQINENNNLQVLKSKQDNIIQQLSVREQELQHELAESNKSLDRLEKLMTDLVEEEMKRVASNANNERSSVEESVASSSFSASRSRLTWPVESGFISSKFGEQAHPVLKGIKVNNNGVGIQTKKGQEVRAVYEGEVLTVATIAGLNKLVAVKHGEYTTVYAKLSKVVVKTGQKVKAKQVIGEVYTDKDGISELQFQIWREKEKLNPENWLNAR
jgi:septal ring factor EnvC (AmiA/AmiB activator)